MSENSDDIDYDGHSIDSRSQIIIQVLRDLGETTAGDLASEAGLDDTSQVHHRVREHLGPDAAELVEQSGTEPRSGGQADEIVYAVTDDGRDSARAHEADLWTPSPPPRRSTCFVGCALSWRDSSTE